MKKDFEKWNKKKRRLTILPSVRFSTNEKFGFVIWERMLVLNKTETERISCVQL